MLSPVTHNATLAHLADPTHRRLRGTPSSLGGVSAGTRNVIDPEIANSWLSPRPIDGFLLEGACVVSLGAHRGSRHLSQRADTAPDFCDPNETTHHWREIWQSHLSPKEQILVSDSMRIESDVYRVELRDVVAPRDTVRRPLMVAKRQALVPESLAALTHLLGQPKSLVPLLGDRYPIPSELRDAFYGRLAQSPSSARRVLLSFDSVMTLHPMAAGDLQHLLQPLRGLGRYGCESATRIVARALLSQLDTMQQARMCHGDIKPENILFWTDGVFAFTDFASASGLWERELLRSSPKVGTLSYSACDELFYQEAFGDGDSTDEEDVRSQQASVWSAQQDITKLFLAADTFALGVTLLTAATGRRPFQVDESDPDPTPLTQRRALWQAIYGDFVAFGRGRRVAPRLSVSLLGRSEEDRVRAHELVDAFRDLRARAPSLVAMIIPMLHPEPQQRPDAQVLLSMLDRPGPSTVRSADQLSAWLTDLVDQGLGPRYRRAEWRPAELAPVRPRRHTIGTQSPRHHGFGPGLAVSRAMRWRDTWNEWLLRDRLVRSAVEPAGRPYPSAGAWSESPLAESPVWSLRRSPSMVSMVSITSGLSSITPMDD